MENEDFGWEPETESRKLQLFTDRHKFTRLFAEYLNENPPRSTILYLYGDGGNGKSLLLKFLRENCCKSLSPAIWSEIKAKSDAEVAQEIQSISDWDSGVKPVPAVLHDFEPLPGGDKRYQHPFDGLLILRRNLANTAEELGYRLKFPFYDYACVWYLYKKGKSMQEISQLFPLSEIAGLIAPLLDLANKNPVGTFGKAVLDIFAKNLGEKFTLYLQQWGLDQLEVEKICKLDVDRELIESLPYWFARDLNAAMTTDITKPPRLVLLFDTHEAFWGHQRDLPQDTFFYMDEWLRRLLKGLKRELGIVVVVAGRETPQWVAATKFKIPPEDLHTDKVGHLSKTDAEDYLQKAGVSDTALVKALIDYASVAPNEAHPFYLGLCADVVLAAAKGGIQLGATDFLKIPTDKCKELINRLLRYVDEDVRDAVHALSACRGFDRDLYLKLSESLRFYATSASFRILTRFSFVWSDVQGRENWYRIHDLIRRLDYQEDNPITRNAHQVLEQYYRQRGDVAEAIYHGACQNWKQGVKEWLEVFNSAKDRRDIKLCQILVEIRNELLKLRKTKPF
jgi:hypothetical protein